MRANKRRDLRGRAQLPQRRERVWERGLVKNLRSLGLIHSLWDLESVVIRIVVIALLGARTVTDVGSRKRFVAGIVRSNQLEVSAGRSVRSVHLFPCFPKAQLLQAPLSKTFALASETQYVAKGPFPANHPRQETDAGRLSPICCQIAACFCCRLGKAQGSSL